MDFFLHGMYSGGFGHATALPQPGAAFYNYMKLLVIYMFNS